MAERYTLIVDVPPIRLRPHTDSDNVSEWFRGLQFVPESAYHEWAADRTGCAFLGTLDGVPVSFVHHTAPKHNDGKATASVVVAPARRGEGIGAATLGALTTAPHLHGARIIGSIDAGNSSSLRSAARAGFTVACRHEDETTVVVESRPRKLVELKPNTGTPDVGEWIADGRDKDVNRREEYLGDFLATHNGEPVGFVRIAGDDWMKWIRAFGLAPEWRGQGLARPFIQAVIRETVRNADAPCEELVVRFPAMNVSAQRCFRSQGFDEKAEYSGGDLICLKYRLAD